jgi:hypothetical protein
MGIETADNLSDDLERAYTHNLFGFANGTYYFNIKYIFSRKKRSKKYRKWLINQRKGIFTT